MFNSLCYNHYISLLLKGKNSSTLANFKMYGVTEVKQFSDYKYENF